MKHFAWAYQRFLQGNISYIVLLTGHYLGIAPERGQYLGMFCRHEFIGTSC